MVWYPPVRHSVSLPEDVPERLRMEDGHSMVQKDIVPAHAYYVIEKTSEQRKYPEDIPVILCYKQSSWRDLLRYINIVSTNKNVCLGGWLIKLAQ